VCTNRRATTAPPLAEERVRAMASNSVFSLSFAYFRPKASPPPADEVQAAPGELNFDSTRNSTFQPAERRQKRGQFKKFNLIQPTSFF
jgi:hypothetical protein